MTAQQRSPLNGVQALTEKEKQTLRLMVRGHDAKSLARHLGLSVHTINERLRDARRKLEVSSSKEAARRLLQTEGDDPNFVGDKLLRDATNDPGIHTAGLEGPNGRRTVRRDGLIAGACLMIAILALTLVSAQVPASSPKAAAEASAQSALADSDAVRAARNFLELGDQSRWADAYAATGASFHQLNTLKLWSDTSLKVRVPLGAVVSRRAISQESIPTPPAGAELVKFRTSFTNKANATETVTLARENGRWKVTGIYLD
jgi:DNA-binding CsgD family transcriptional regulator